MLQVQKLESLGVLAGGIAHDFNNLLMTILGNADLALADLPEHSAARESLSDIVRASRRAADLCRQMLAYSGKGRFCVEPVSLNDLIEEMAHLLVVSISKKVTLQCRFADNLPYVDGDATQLRQIVMNLITNASEAIEAEAGVVTLATGIEDCGPDGPAGTVAQERLPGGPYVYVEVRDTGCGMEPETLARIFDPFFTTKFTGRGLGLAAVLGIVRGHKGAIRVKSELGQGTTFRVLFPADTKFHPTETGPADLWAAPAPRISGVILLVDDEPGVREVAGRMLATAGFEVAIAASGAEAVDIVREAPERIACVLLDLTMPQMDGEETLVRLRAVRGDLPVVISSGYSEQEIVRRFAGRNLTGFIQKPYVRAQLVSVLSHVASRRSGGAQAAGGTGAPPAV
jgi:CheY-like chemotaxis protein